MNPSPQRAEPDSEDSQLPELEPGEEWLDEADVQQIRWMLSLTSTERLQVLQDFVDGVTRLRDGRVGSSKRCGKSTPAPRICPGVT